LKDVRKSDDDIVKDARRWRAIAMLIEKTLVLSTLFKKSLPPPRSSYSIEPNH
jgi:hypothetical protein